MSAAAVPFAIAIAVFAASAARMLEKLSSASALGLPALTLTARPLPYTPVPLSVGTSRRKPGVRISRIGRTGEVRST